MFRRIGATVAKRQQALTKQQQTHNELNNAIGEAMRCVFGPVFDRILFSATLKNGTLIIQTNEKIVAQELIFHSAELYRVLRERNIKYRQVIIR
ncbi:MAG: hypothetical protein A3C88_00610 [Candidatus Yanofskybacteria bacterium RIFCSPHIGHO2_02_FULL_50_12]|uniref:DUF721 domain-containing protein n=1 Tax=Candidatus Yanofskybacteria bacterium RIFCSPHIGHO2_02_FULL_50_12 TaxID=1802685 RepID=A0A1F8FV13_9BACT|nr:MAG: hypothetical protein A3C88_00610 [Candidatus Yanofskybacteria bacterium RIFCSPHIGHO2_02_FULL_50_12]